MATKKRPTKKEGKSLKLEGQAEDAVKAGIEDIGEGLKTLEKARTAEDLGDIALAGAVRSATQAEDALNTAGILADMSYSTYMAGQTDYVEGAGLVALSGDINLMSTTVRTIAVDDFSRGMELAGMYGQIATISDVLSTADMPAISAFMRAMSSRLKEIAISEIFRARSIQDLASKIQSTGEEVAAFGVNEMGEGVTRIAVSEGLAEASQEMTETAETKFAESLVEQAAAEEIEKISEAYGKQGIAQVTTGASELGEAKEMAEELGKN